MFLAPRIPLVLRCLANTGAPASVAGSGEPLTRLGIQPLLVKHPLVYIFEKGADDVQVSTTKRSRPEYHADDSVDGAGAAS